MDIVYTLKHSAQNEELIYSMRSLCNIEHQRVYTVGGAPECLNKNTVTHIEASEQDNKYATTLHNLEIICNDSRVSEDFIWMNDDFYIMQQILNVDELCLNKGYIKPWVIAFKQRNRMLTKYMTGVQNTLNYLTGELLIHNPLCYELHTPFIYNKTRVKHMLSLPNIKRVPMLQPRSVYGNIYDLAGITVEDVKILRSTVIDYQELNKQKFLSSSDFTWPTIKPYLMKKFKEKCKYEI